MMADRFEIAGYGVADLAADIVAPGAFAQSLTARPAAGIAMLFQHDPDRPIGQWLQVREDASGVWVHGEINPALARAHMPARLVKAGVAEGLSIGFRTMSAIPRRQGGRILRQLDLHEVSIVTFPMLPRARLRVANDRPGRVTRPTIPVNTVA